MGSSLHALGDSALRTRPLRALGGRLVHTTSGRGWSERSPDMQLGLMGCALPRRDAEPMAENAFLRPDTDGPAGIQLTETEYADLVTELETLRASHRAELAERLRNARDFGPAAENDDLHAVLEDAAIDRARIAQLEELLRFASIVERSDAVDGTRGPRLQRARRGRARCDGTLRADRTP